MSCVRTIAKNRCVVAAANFDLKIWKLFCDIYPDSRVAKSSLPKKDCIYFEAKLGLNNTQEGYKCLLNEFSLRSIVSCFPLKHVAEFLRLECSHEVAEFGEVKREYFVVPRQFLLVFNFTFELEVQIVPNE